MTPPSKSPYGNFNFEVSFGTAVFGGFSAITGLDSASSATDYREGSPLKPPVGKNPGYTKYEAITLERGVVHDQQFSDWLEQGKLRAKSARRTVTIVLKNKKGAPIRRWTLQNAWPVKYVGPALSGKGTDVAIESVELTAESVVVN